jgi:hypothetical protein
MDPAPVPYNTITLGSTANFTVQYEDADRGANQAYNADALIVVQRRAQHLLDVCERDFGILCSWFGIRVGDGFGPSNRIQVLLTTSDTRGGAYNQGYGSPSLVHANPHASSSPATSDDETIAGLVMAEVIEILMAYRGNWGPGDSNGEGLSRVAAHLLHPAIVTSTALDPAPVDISWWMTSSPTNSSGWGGTPSSLSSHNAFRQDWVSTTFTGESGVHGDGDWFSFGCAILFIYYLKDQLGFTMPQIVQTTGSTLEARYQALTSTSGGFAPFKAVLDAFYPAGVGLPPLYDLFPLGGRNCRVGVAAFTVQDGAPTVGSTGTAEVFTMCGPRQFSYTIDDLHNHLHVDANVFGFANPLVAWTVNGQDIPAGGASGLDVSALVIPVDPTVTAAPVTQSVVLDVTVGPAPSYPAMITFLDVVVRGNPGRVQLRFDVSVTDSNATAPENVATSFALPILDTQQLVWEPEYRRVVDECWNRYIQTHNRRLPWLRRYMPDPPPDLLVAARILDELAAELHQLAKDDPKLAQQAERNLGGLLTTRTKG